MHADRWNRVAELFELVLDQPADERLAWLLRNVNGDLDLLAIVKRMLDEHSRVERAHFLVDGPCTGPNPGTSLDPTMQGARPRPTESREPRPWRGSTATDPDQESSADA